jgi:hypothetical protein
MSMLSSKSGSALLAEAEVTRASSSSSAAAGSLGAGLRATPELPTDEGAAERSLSMLAWMRCKRAEIA